METTAVTPLEKFHAFAAPRGDGLHPGFADCWIALPT
jgi:hypothetical protein